MGIYLNPQNKGFQQAVNSEIYVDKTGLIRLTNKYINTEQKFICVSRPRRFRMLAAYYSRGCDSKDLFRNFRIADDENFQAHLNQYDVICLNMQQFQIESEGRDITKYLSRDVVDELREEYPSFLKDPAGFMQRQTSSLFF